MDTEMIRLPAGGTPFMEIHPCAGLANRLRAIASAMCAAQDLSRALVIVWKQEPGICTGTFKNLFDTDALPSWVYLNDGEYVQSNFKQHQCLSPADWKRIAGWTQDPRMHLNLKSHGKFYDSDEPRWLGNLRSLKVHPSIERNVNITLGRTLSQFSKIVGVHVRRTDNQKSIAESPLWAFQREMDAYGPDTAFLVASDDPVERELLIQRYPGRCVVLAGILTRATTIGLINAATDWYALSRCSEILGSYNSSFSEMASAYGDVPLKIVRIEPIQA